MKKSVKKTESVKKGKKVKKTKKVVKEPKEIQTKLLHFDFKKKASEK